MSSQCVMCSAKVRTGRILCDDCEKPRKRAGTVSKTETPVEKGPANKGSTSVIHTEGLAALFGGTGMEAVVIIKGILEHLSSAAAETFSHLGTVDLPSIQRALGIDLDETSDGVYDVRIGGKARQFVVASIGTDVRVIGFAPLADTGEAPQLEFLRETVIHPLRSLAESLEAAAHHRGSDPVLRDAARTIDQALSSLELSPDLGGSETAGEVSYTIAGILENVHMRFQSLANQKKISLALDVSSGGESNFGEPGPLGEALATYVDNSLRYTPVGGQSVLGVREMDHKGTPIHLFFVMDNGPVVPEEYREAIFSPGFVWDPASTTRTGRDLAQCRKFANRHGGKAWVDARTGRACTFYLSVAR